jgi:hypothetical protein
MNLNSSLNFNLDPKQLLVVLNRYRKLLLTITIIGLLGYTGYQISQISAVQADQTYTQSKQKDSAVVNLRVNKNTLEQLQSLHPAGQSSTPVNVGKHDPFSL